MAEHDIAWHQSPTSSDGGKYGIAQHRMVERLLGSGCRCFRDHKACSLTPALLCSAVWQSMTALLCSAVWQDTWGHWGGSGDCRDYIRWRW